jgi:hypothetical protein
MANSRTAGDFIDPCDLPHAGALPHPLASVTIAANHILGSSFMRAFAITSLAIVLFGVSSVGICQTSTNNDTARAGTFKQVVGDTWIGGAGERRAAMSGDGVRATQRISTGDTGAASITLKDGTVLTVGPNSTMDLSQFEFNSTTQEGSLLLDLIQGSVRVVTGLLGKANPDKFKVQTPTSLVGVRGTDFIVQTDAVN